MQKFKMQLNKSGIQRDNRLKMQSYELTHTLHMLAGYQAVFIRCITLSRDLQLLWRIIDFHLEHTYHFFLWVTLSLQHGKTLKSCSFDEKFFLNRMPYSHLLLKQTLDYEHQLKTLILDDLNHLYSVQKVVTSSSYEKH